MKKEGHANRILCNKINHISGGASINYGPSFHKGLQANVKINTGEIAIGDEFTFQGSEEENNAEDNAQQKKQKGKFRI
ncbi:hypothetical protein [Virgibacillus sp. YIM 98842]|uniref:hypothetical protein n=1 Tax=Virgibacillus sp. YIM 98842 TaxID=2663533 RepID=UPI0013DC28B5|nr:hypothetical protein [Virgibacillus sp. YIM 98842]